MGDVPTSGSIGELLDPDAFADATGAWMPPKIEVSSVPTSWLATAVKDSASTAHTEIFILSRDSGERESCSWLTARSQIDKCVLAKVGGCSSHRHATANQRKPRDPN